MTPLGGGSWTREGGDSIVCFFPTPPGLVLKAHPIPGLKTASRESPEPVACPDDCVNMWHVVQCDESLIDELHLVPGRCALFAGGITVCAIGMYAVGWST
ncbi:glycosyhydrolase [Anopheles sinensis]|uniref:Glycosyhydrolase n=1 Tax=Anopheles sinensis TaxID=74873 RepID=A0A084VBS6_ANOSI|nr:glycosyhydrolase [Anopheles sinensis]